VRGTARNLPARQFLESIDGQHLLQESDQLHVLSPEAAATCCFRPDDHAEFAEHGTETQVSSNQAGRVDGAVWIETATVFASTSAIEKAVLTATAGERRSIKISRRTQTPTEQILGEIFSQALGLEAIGADDDFFDLGVHSLMAVQLVSRIRERFDFQLSIRALFECSTIAKLAEAIGQQTTTGYQALVPLQIGDDIPALFCCHPANGDAVCYMRLTKALGLDQTVYGFEASGLSPGEPLARSLAEMAHAYVKEMIAVQPKGPYHLLGWSFGGALAFEIARQIHATGGQIGLLGYMDAVAPDNGPLVQFEPRENFEFTQEEERELEAKLLEGIAGQLKTMRRYAKLSPLDDAGTALTWQQAIEGFQSMGIVPDDYSIEEMRRKMFVYGNCGILFSQYRPPPLPSPIVHFQASQNFQEWDFDWSPYTTRGVQTIWIRCNHFRMGFEPNINVIAAHLRAIIRGDRRALGWWRRAPLANSVEGLIGRLAFQRG
jgi:thioesterase domain-containing protein/acyl carrier protein